LAGRRHGSGDEFGGRKRLDPDGLRQLRADAETDVADLANDVGVLAKKFDPLLLAKPQLAQAMGDLRSSAKLPDPAGRADAHLTERTNKRFLATFACVSRWQLFAHGGKVV